MPNVFKITADSEPILDKWGWDFYWSLNDWLVWHREMKKKYGNEKANRIFISWWDKQTFGASPLEHFAYDTNFTDYTDKEKLSDAIWSHPAAPPRIIRASVNIVKSVGGTAENLVGAAENVAKTIKIIIPIFLISTLVIGSVILYQRLKTV